MKLGMSFRQLARMNTPRGCSSQGRVRTPHPRQASGETKVFEGLTLVEWYLNNDKLDEAKKLMAKIQAEEAVA